MTFTVMRSRITHYTTHVSRPIYIPFIHLIKKIYVVFGQLFYLTNCVLFTKTGFGYRNKLNPLYLTAFLRDCERIRSKTAKST